MLTEQPHRRLNALTGEWVLVSPHRTQRPWQGQVEKTTPPDAGHLRSELLSVPRKCSRRRGPQPAYEGTFVFDNDFAALKPEIEAFETNEQRSCWSRNRSAASAGSSVSCRITASRSRA